MVQKWRKVSFVILQGCHAQSVKIDIISKSSPNRCQLEQNGRQICVPQVQISSKNHFDWEKSKMVAVSIVGQKIPNLD